MSYYKSCKYIKFRHQIIIDNYINGYHVYWDKYNTMHKSLLETGMNTHNKNFYTQFNNLKSNYGALISIQSSLINLMKEYVSTQHGEIANIWRIMRSQKGTIECYNSFLIALSKYKIKHQNVYDAITGKIKKDTERLERNTIFVDDTIKRCGLEPIIDLIKHQYNETLVEHTRKFQKEFIANYDGPIDRVYFDKRDNAYTTHIKELASNNGINLEQLLKEYEAIAKAKYEETKKQIRQEKFENDKIALQKVADRLNMTHNINLFHAIQSGDMQKYLSTPAYKRLIRTLNSMNGKCYFITYLAKSQLKMYTMDGKFSASMQNAMYFADKNDTKLIKIVNKLKNDNKKAIISIESIAYNGVK